MTGTAVRVRITGGASALLPQEHPETGESAAVLAMRQLVRVAHRPPFGFSRSRRHTLERLTALAERRAALRGAESLRESNRPPSSERASG